MPQYFNQNDDNVKSDLDYIYRRCRDKFCAWLVKMFRCSTDDALGVFHDAIIVYEQKLRNGTVKQLKSTEETFLFAIGKNKLYEMLRKRKKLILKEEMPELRVEQVDGKRAYDDTRMNLVRKAMTKISDSCKETLKMFYLEGMSLEDIKELKGHKSKNTTKTQKSKCLDKIRQNIHAYTNGENQY